MSTSTPEAGGSGGSTASSGADRRRWAGLFFVALGVAAIIVDATIVNVAVPSIIDDLGITGSEAQWVQEAYTLVFAAFLLMFGRLADRWGRRRIFVIGVVVFMAASVWCALAGSGAELIAARLAQGLGGAMMLPTSLSLINANFRGKDRALAFAIWGSTIGGAAALGPLLGGWLTTEFSWRWAFGINIPIGIVVLAGTWIFMRESRDTHAQRGVDVVGAVLSVVAVGLLVFGLIEGRVYGWWAMVGGDSVAGIPWPWSISPVPVAFAGAAIAAGVFVWVEAARNRAAKPVLLDLKLLGIRSFRNGNIAAGIVSLGEFGLLFALPLWLQNVLGYSAFDTGKILLALALGSFVASGFGAALTRARGPVLVVRLGIVLEIVGVLGIGLIAAPDVSVWPVVAFLFVYGLGVGLATAQLTGVVLHDVPVEASGQGSGIQSTTRQIGSALGIAVLGTVLFTALGQQLNSALEQVPGLPAAVREETVSGVVTTAGSIIPSLAENPATAPIAAAAGEALSTATGWAAYVAAGFLVLGLLASFSLGHPTAAISDSAATGPDAGVG
ncbi:MAG: MFS transporter [Actinobacteria bacterium]|nr:MFS transporter [Actinomycetota bacterium]